MTRSGVAMRLLPLLDITLILLGMLMIVLAQTQMAASEGSATAEATNSPTTTAFGYQFVYLYFGTGGTERGRCYTLDEHGLPDREIASGDDFRNYLRRKCPDHDPQRTVVLLLVSDAGFDSVWDEARRERMEDEFGVQLKEVYNYRPARSLP